MALVLSVACDQCGFKRSGRPRCATGTSTSNGSPVDDGWSCDIDS
jgi:hypothetical protein